MAPTPTPKEFFVSVFKAWGENVSGTFQIVFTVLFTVVITAASIFTVISKEVEVRIFSGALGLLALFIAIYKVWEKERNDVRVLEEQKTPRIKLFVDDIDHGVLEVPTMIQELVGGQLRPTGQRGPSSKWVQVTVACATNASLVDCEVRLAKVIRLEDGVQLVEEHVGCQWSQTAPEVRKISISPALPHRANLFSFYENSPIAHLETMPKKVRLSDGIQKPGKYRMIIVATAKDAPHEQGSFILEWHGFNRISLTEEVAVG